MSPSWGAKRALARTQLESARAAADAVRGFNAASRGRRAGSDWTAVGEGKPTEGSMDLATLRARARESARNNPYWKSAKRAIPRQIVGRGLRATVTGPNERNRERVQKAWDEWADSKLADAAERLDFYGIQRLVMGSVVNDGECIVRRVQTREGLRLQVLGAEYLSDAKDGEISGGEIVGGVETNEYGAPRAYHLFQRHPSRVLGGVHSVRVPAQDIAHVFLLDRPQQQRGESWIAPVFTRLQDWDDYEDAALMQQKVAACFGAVYSGGVQPEGDHEVHEKLEPGMVEFLPAGTEVKTITPPPSAGIRDHAVINHRGIATGLGITYEALTGDFSQVNFSSARMGQMQMHGNVVEWQEQVMIDLLCDVVWRWFLESMTLTSDVSLAGLSVEWTCPAVEMIDPEKETVANTKRVRSGFASWSDVVRESGRDPQKVATLIAADLKRFDDLGIVLDVDPRHVSTQGQGGVNQQQEGGSDGGTTKKAKSE
jgi:lambda family phage portal protein